MPVLKYATVNDLKAIGLSERALERISKIDIETALQDASAYIDGYLNRRFALPLSAWGRDITRAVCVLAAYDLRTANGYNPNSNADEALERRVETLTAWLENIARGVVVPAGIVDSSVTPSTALSESENVTAESDPPRGW